MEHGAVGGEIGMGFWQDVLIEDFCPLMLLSRYLYCVLFANVSQHILYNYYQITCLILRAGQQTHFGALLYRQSCLQLANCLIGADKHDPANGMYGRYARILIDCDDSFAVWRCEYIYHAD